MHKIKMQVLILFSNMNPQKTPKNTKPTNIFFL